LLATFGFCLPHKGLPEVIDAVAQLRTHGQPVRLLMLNAEHPDPASARMAQALREQIVRLRLDGCVDLRTAFLPDAEAAALLEQADLLVFAYQGTQESASGAVRHALATARPVLVTPVPIFDELGSAVFRAAGTSADALAVALKRTLSSLASGDEQASAVQEAASRLREALDVGRLAQRLWNIVGGLWVAQPAQPVWRFSGNSRMLRSNVGRVSEQGRSGHGEAGMLLFGPYLPLPAGQHMLSLRWRARLPRGAKLSVRIVCQGATRTLAERRFSGGEVCPAELMLPFELDRACADAEVHLEIDARSDVQVESVVFQRHPRAAAAAGAPREQA
jgi:hypothetical protein